MTTPTPLCELCGEPMPPGEETLKFHGYSGPCPKSHLPSLQRKRTYEELEIALATAEGRISGLVGVAARREAERDELRRKAGTLVDDCERITGLSISQLDWDAAVVKMLEESKKDAERLTAIETGEVVVVMDEPTGEVRAIRRGLNAFDVQNWVAAKTLRAAIDAARQAGEK